MCEAVGAKKNESLEEDIDDAGLTMDQVVKKERREKRKEESTERITGRANQPK